MVSPEVRSLYNFDPDEWSSLHGLRCPPEEGRTQQQFVEDADINVVVGRFLKTGELPEGWSAPTYGDFSDVGDFRTAMEAVRDASSSFMALPAKVRARFSNDPQQLMEFLADASNREEADRLGLLAKPPEKTRDAVVAIDELAAAVKAAASPDGRKPEEGGRKAPS